MKKLAALLLILSLSVFSIGCGGDDGGAAGGGGDGGGDGETTEPTETDT